MKKIIPIALVIIVIIAGIFIIKGFNKNEDNENKKGGIDLKLDFSHMNKTIYNAHINITSDDKIKEFDKEEPNEVTIENEKDGYGIDLTLNTEAKEGYEQLQTSAKSNNIYEEVKFGKYEGYYSNDGDEIYGYILLDKSDSTFNAFVMFNVYSLDDNENSSDIQNTFKSSKIQNILNNIEFKTSK